MIVVWAKGRQNVKVRKMKRDQSNLKPPTIEEVLARGVKEISVLESLKKKLSSGQSLTVKFGIDPTSPKIHLGRAIPLWKLRELQLLGHKIVLIVGDFTAQIGDPSDKLGKRPMLLAKDIAENLKTYRQQIGKILDLKKVTFLKNSRWLKKLRFAEIAELAEAFSVAQMLERRNFKDRFGRGDPISVREFLYPLLQGFDSVKVSADLEIGGEDQLFNLHAGRTIQPIYGQSPQDILTTEMLEGTDGRKMSSSWGNVISITDSPAEMYGKIMSLKDELILRYFTLTTSLPTSAILDIENSLKNGLNPKDAKMRLAREIVTRYFGVKSAMSAEADFVNTFQKGGRPEEILEINYFVGKDQLANLLIEREVVGSRAAWQRLIREGAVEVEGVKIKDVFWEPTESVVLKIGKFRFLKINLISS